VPRRSGLVRHALRRVPRQPAGRPLGLRLRRQKGTGG
jgi:hypothetical protein